MRIDIMTLFPETLGDVLSESILGRAQERGYIAINTHQIRDYTANKQNQVDDYPYGGGRGAVMTADPLYRCWEAVCDEAAGLLADRFPAAIQRIRRHHRTTTAAIGVVVHLILLVGGVIPDLMGLDADEASLLSPAQNALAQNITKRVGKQGHDVNSHRCASLR